MFGEDMNDHWLIIGGGPSVRNGVFAPNGPVIFRPDMKIITANAGGYIVLPDIYWISDPVAIARYRPFWETFAGEVICNDQSVNDARGSLQTTRFPYIDKGPIYHGRCSGVLCCRVAISRGARELTLVGFQGYKPTDPLEGVDGKPIGERGEQALKVNAAQAAAFADIAAKHPDVRVTVYGPTKIEFPEAWRVL